ncbi:MAG: outer membrane protein assembly factor BamA [Candidatus Omnitrophota bacterium]
MKRNIFFFIFVFIIPLAFSQEIISKIEIKGNNIVSESKIISKIKSRANQSYNDNLINEDLKNLYATGFFDNIEIEKTQTPHGIIVTFNFKEKPVIKDVSVKGAKRVNKRRIEKLIDVEEGSFLDEYKLKEIENTISDFYRKRGFAAAEAKYTVVVDGDNKASVVFSIDEKETSRIKMVTVKGNSFLNTKKIKKLIKTRTKGFLRKGILKNEILEDDIKRVEDFYKERGFSEVAVDYAIDYVGKDIYITITINEGSRSYMGRVKVEGNKKIASSEIDKVIDLRSGEVYVDKRIGENVNNIRGVYVDEGFIYAQVNPVTYYNPQTDKIDVTFNIIENDVAYVEKIEVRGNVKTKDKVIRRELRIYPGDKFAGVKIRKSRQRLDNLGFFEEIRFDSKKGSKANWEDLIVDVKETKTGYMSFGGGYSSIDQLTGFVEVRQRNFDYKNWSTFTGGGQDLSFLASFGSITKRYEVNFFNPWIFDKPIFFGFEGYKRGHDREEDVGYGYQEDVTGAAIKFGKEFSDTYKAWVGYRFETVDIANVSETASNALKEETGSNGFSTIEVGSSFDTRDNVFSPSKGIYFVNSLETSGGFIGGDKDFAKVNSQTSVFFPLINKSVIEFRAKAGLADAFSDTEKIPIYKRFFSGGASTIRGYHERKIGPIDSISGDPLGGEALFVGNVEYVYPLVDVLKMATFFDSGNVWGKRSDFLSGGLKSSVGLGVRVKTPLGPVKLDYGWPLNKEPGEEGKEGRFHFSISRGF